MSKLILKITVGSAIVLGGLVLSSPDSFGKTEYTKKEGKGCTFCHTAAGKKDFQQQITVTPGQETRINARLGDITGTVAVKTLPGSDVFLDDSSQGTADAEGQLSIPGVAVGPHELRISADGKKDFRRKTMKSGSFPFPGNSPNSAWPINSGMPLKRLIDVVTPWRSAGR